MNRFGSFFLILILSISCSRTDDELDYRENGVVGKWELFSSTGVWGDSPVTTGTDLPWQETYIFKTDSTFTKTRDQDGRINEVIGTYSEDTQRTDGFYFVLEYMTDNDIVYSCSRMTEYLELKKGFLSNTSWAPCDGPILDYIWVE